MSKLRKFIQATGLLLQKPYLINRIIDDNDHWKRRVERSHGVTRLPEVSFSKLLAGREIRVKPFAFLEGGSLPTDLALLRLLAMRFKDCEYFEIGMWRGESVANVADLAASCTTLNLSAKQMKELGLAEEYIRQHGMFSDHLPNVKQIEGNSLEFDFSSPGKKYDLVFIDGDHHYESILSDTKNVFEHFLHDKSIVVWHDHAWQPGNVRYETLAAILDGVPESLHAHLYEVRNTLCAMYYPGEIISGPAKAVADKDEAFTLSIE